MQNKNMLQKKIMTIKMQSSPEEMQNNHKDAKQK